ncbi:MULTISPECIES: hypothetical protein [Rhodopseudomonas]|uniref:hypothetical protein n=1 Tax=Rhodopseudomonas TaxID=1073 RepID=UPI0002D9A428|nr:MULTISPECIES: hypothetical protein [Rhodopseudomonas]
MQANDRQVLVLAASLSGVTPLPGDRVAVRGVTFTANATSTDPATAVWEIQGRM